MDTATKKAENTQVKKLLRELGYSGVRVSHSGHGWLDISVTIDKTFDCTCSDMSPNRGRCMTCADIWYEAYTQIKTEAKAETGRTGEYDGYIQVKVTLQ